MNEFAQFTPHPIADNRSIQTSAIKAVTQIPGWVSALATERDTISKPAAAYAYVPLIYRALRLRCDSLSAVPVYVERERKDGENERAPWPWPDTDIPALIWITEASLLLAGAAFWLKRTNPARRTRALQPLNPFGMTVDTNGDELTFTYTWTSGSKTESAVYTADQIVYFREYHPLDDIAPGISSTQVALSGAALQRYAVRFAAHFFEGGAMPVVLLGIPAGTPDVERDRTENYFRRLVTSIRNAWRVIAVRAGIVDVKILTPPLRDLVIPELSELALSEISAAYGIRKSILGDPANYATAKEDWDSFWKSTVRPRGRFYESVINRQLLAPLGLSVNFAFDELDVFQEDEHQRSGSLKNLVDSGLPLDLAIEMLGYDLTDDQQRRLDAFLKEKEERAAALMNESLNQTPENNQQAEDQTNEPNSDTPFRADLLRWRSKATRALERTGSATCDFKLSTIPPSIAAEIAASLPAATTPAEIDAIFESYLSSAKNTTPAADLVAELRRANELLAQVLK